MEATTIPAPLPPPAAESDDLHASQRDRHNVFMCAAGEGLWSLGMGLVSSGTVFPFLLTALGMGPSVIGLVGTIESACAIIPQLLGAFLFRGTDNLRVRLAFWHAAYVVPFIVVMALLLCFSPRLSPMLVATGLLVCWGGFYACVSVIVASWIDWLGHVFSPRIRGTVFGLLGAVASAAAALAGLVAGWLVAGDDSVTGYARNYFIAAGLGVVSMGAFYLMKDTPALAEHTQAASQGRAPAHAPWASVRASMAASLRDRTVRGFLIARSLSVMGFAFPPFMSLHFASSQGGNLSTEFIFSCGAAQALGTAAGCLVMGRVGDKRGHRLGLIVGAALQCVALVIPLCFVGGWPCVASFVLAGLAMGGTSVAHSNLLLESCPHDQRQAHITICNVTLAIPAATAPLLAGLLAEHYDELRFHLFVYIVPRLPTAATQTLISLLSGSVGYLPIFIASLAMSLAATTWILARLHDPRNLHVHH
ncbi:MAG: MFS transporter [Planctomycetota bacterium]|nr:MFS transporter [Planctomycetota bacterium]